MIRSILNITIRNFFKHRLFSMINVTGLALGLSASILIGLYIYDEMIYDRHHPHADRIYRVTSYSDFGGVVEKSSSCPAPLAPALQLEFAQSVETFTRVFNDWGTEYRVEVEDKNPFGQAKVFRERRLYFADSTFFGIFGAGFLAGDSVHSLQNPQSVVVTASTARKLFGTTDVMGKKLKVDGFFPLTITGVVNDPPLQSHFHYDYVVSIRTLAMRHNGRLPQTWVWNPFWTYIRLSPNVDAAAFEKSFPAFVQKYFYDAEKNHITLGLQPLTSIHLHSALDYEIEPNGKSSYVRILGYIAVFLLVIAIINFMNLSTATSAGRAREVGVKKVFGASRSQLIGQFFFESVTMAFLALLVAAILINVALPAFNRFTAKDLSLGLLFTWPGIGYLGLLWLLTGLLAGTYPSLFLSSFRPVSVLKGKLTLGSRSVTARKVLVTLQFTVSIVLIVCTFSAYRQLNYLRNTALGFNKENILMLPVQRLPVVARFDDFKAQLLNQPGVMSVTSVDYIPGKDHNSHEFHIEGFPSDKWQFYPALVVREDFVKTFGIEIVAGRDYQTGSKSDPADAILINESMVKHLGWKSNQEALGKKFSSLRGQERVVGVFKDINAKSLHHPRSPLVLNMKEADWEIRYFTTFVAIRLNPSVPYPQVLSRIEKIWDVYNGGISFDYFFLDKTLDHLYRHEEKTGQISAMLTFFVIIVASMGLLGLVSYMAIQRTREIGVRRVLGAPVVSIVRLMSGDFLLLVVYALLLAIPAGYLLTDYWLAQFAFRSPVSPLIFMMAGIISSGVALLITSLMAVRTAKIQPAEALKYE